MDKIGTGAVKEDMDSPDFEKGKHGDVESPPESPTSPPDADADASEKAPKTAAPEPPRWRFVNEAKKSSGYSSLHAGSYIEGRCSEELGGKYVAPDISLYKPAREVANVGKSERALPKSEPFPDKEDVEVGKLGPGAPRRDPLSNSNNEVGKLNIRQVLFVEGDAPSGSFPGLPKRESNEIGPREPFKEWGTNLHVSPKKDRTNVWYDGKITDSYTMPGNETSGKEHAGVGKIGFRRPGESEENFDGEFPRGSSARSGDDAGKEGFEDVDEYGEPREGTIFVHRSDDSTGSNNDNGLSAAPAAHAETTVEKNEKRKRKYLLLLLLPLFILVIVLAVLLGTKTERKDVAAVGGVIPPPFVAVNKTSVPSLDPSVSPTELPSSAPTPFVTPAPTPQLATEQPTGKPTPNPTCSTEQAFNVCLAVDMSGSVCNDGSGSECQSCRASSFLPMFFASKCRDNSVDEDTCCDNFAKVKAFSSLMVASLDEFPADKSFSIVQFATNARLVGDLSSTEEVLPVIERLDYTGGLTNHAAAIRTCQQTFSSGGDDDDGGRKNFVMLITDGVSTEPGFDPAGTAEAAAMSAKSEGTFLVPVFISPNGNDPAAYAFMRRLGSDGKVFDVTDFDSLDSLRDRLVDRVSCA